MSSDRIPEEQGDAAVEVSVVIACKNEERYIGAMLESLAHQTWNGWWEIIVADNGSTDSTREVVESFFARLPHLALIDASAHPGYAPARNLAVRRARGEKILFVDGDDEVSDGYVSAMAAALDRYDLVCARLGFERLNSRWVLDMWPDRWQQEGPQDNFDFLPFAGSGTLGVRRALFEKLNGFNHYRQPSQFEEADFCWRIQLAGGEAPMLVPEAILHYRLPRTLRGVYRRGRNYARGQIVLFEQYQAQGMQRPRRVSFRDVLGVVRRIKSRHDLARAAHVIGRFVGQRTVVHPD